MRKWRVGWLVALFVALVCAGAAVAQELPVLWEDHFEDEDPPALKNVGWLYYGVEDGLVGQVIEQQQFEGENVLYMKSGNYQVVGVALVETNGVPEIDPNDLEKTHKLLVANNYSSPNQVTSFRVYFKTITSSFFVAAARMVQMDTSETVPDADPTESPAYLVFVSPLEGKVRLAKYEGPMAALQPESWTYFGEADFTFELGVWYWFKYELNGGDFKVKVWEGFPEDEPADWLLAVTDAEPRVTGKFNMFAIFGQPPGGDEIYLDDVVVRSAEATAVTSEASVMPSDYRLEQNYPNPFNPATEIAFSVPKDEHVRLSVFDARGRLVKTLVDAEVKAGTHRVTFEAGDLPSGLYLYRMQAGDQVLQRKMLLLK